VSTKGKLPPVKADSLVMRSLVIRAEGQSLRVVTATESPVMRYDESRGMTVAEVLEMDGIEMRAGQTQIPIVDSHDESTVRNIFGSLRNLSINGDEFGGVPYFASDPDSQAAEAKLRDGHLTDFSITAIPREVLTTERGQKYTTPRGTVVDGPANIVTRWTPINASLVATGADERSTVRRSYTAANKEVKRMDETLLAQLAAMGMPEGMTDPNQILAWVVGRMGSATPAASVEMPEPMESASPEMSEEPEPEEVVLENAMDETKRAQNASEQIKRALAADQSRRKEITSLCTLHRIDRAFADELCDGFVSLDDARKRILERMATQPVGQTAESARVVGSEQDRVTDAIGGGLILRALNAARVSKASAKVAEQSQEFSRMPIVRTAEILLRSYGINTDRMTPKDVAQVAMGNREASRRFGIERTAYHTTGAFPNLLADVANKTLLAAYDEAPYTWSIWARQGASSPDFKQINRSRFSESPDPEIVPERQPYPEKRMSDSKESYTVEKYGAMFSVSWETVVNDDLDAISRVPAMHGNAMRRKQNKVVYSVLTANDVLSDNVALFNATHANVSSGAGVPSVTTLNAGFLAMAKQTGLSSDAVLNLAPRYLIVPQAYAATAMELLNSTANPAVGGSAVGSSGVANIYNMAGGRQLTMVADANLDLNSSAIWYLAADPAQIETVEISFLEGEESPVLEQEWDFDRDCYKYKIRQTFGAKAIDYRGLYRNSA
jgi:hypothetical protein